MTDELSLMSNKKIEGRELNFTFQCENHLRSFEAFAELVFNNQSG